MKYQLFYLSMGHIYKLSDLDPEKYDIEFDTPEEAYSCFQGWVAMGDAHYPKVTIVVLPVVQKAEG